MTGIWVDTDFGFDDLWALLLLRKFGCRVAGVSLVAGNAILAQVCTNACAAKSVYGFDWPLWKGAATPLVRQQETCERILGPTGMRTRGKALGSASGEKIQTGAVEAMCSWLGSEPTQPKKLLALGPLTNVAHLVQKEPRLARKIERLVWMGASTGAGNHTPLAEFNAYADAEALSEVLAFGIPIDIVDLNFCRSVTFGETDIPITDPLTDDLLGGYLDIGLQRGRSGMAIYDPIAAIAISQHSCISFEARHVEVSTKPDETYGATRFSNTNASHVRVATVAHCDLRAICLDALQREQVNV